ncbi:fibronectin type III domain-containing protein [Luteolibacter ambystomatis]|uniref:Fibronectin type III domain-containing protein n=1 Tax=Luteolibacter ambystomatis TaxID=2824561 RepID=A0A975IXK2_9BACT|nr:fibronectin type III domain-containing protein [Luteolibacter ambystomatis]QUE49411.1 fibronectin type III domain-containing protein [Luteolibacter ambystomatis]
MGFSLGGASAVSTDIESLGNEVRFLSGSQVSRLDLQAGTWGTAIRMTKAASPTAFVWDRIHEFAIAPGGIYRANADGSGEALFLPGVNTGGLVLSGNALHVISGSKVSAYDRFTGTLLSEVAFATDLGGARWKSTEGGSVAVGVKVENGAVTVLRLDVGVQPAVVEKSTLPLASAANFWPSRNGTRVWFANGSLWQLGASPVKQVDLGTPVSAAAFFTLDQYAVVTGTTVKVLDAAGAVLGQTSPTSVPTDLFTSGSTLCEIKDAGTRPTLTKVLWQNLGFGSGAVPAPPPVPIAYSSQPRFVRQGKEVGMTILSSSASQLARWSPEEMDYRASIALPAAGTVEYVPKEDRVVYFPSNGTAVRTGDFSGGSWLAAPAFPASSYDGNVTASADRSALVKYPGGYAELNTATNTWTTNTASFDRDAVWNAATDEILSSDSSALEIYRRPWSNLFSQVVPPGSGRPGTPLVCVTPDGSRAATGSGFVFASQPWRQTADLGVTVTDAAWLDAAKLATIRPAPDGSTRVEFRRGRKLAAFSETVLPGTPVRLFALDSGAVAVTLVSGLPVMFHFDADGRLLHAPSMPAFPAAAPAIVTRGATSLVVSWSLPQGAGDAVRLEYRKATSTGAWTSSGVFPPSATGATVGGLTANTSYQIRVVALRRSSEAASTALTMATLKSATTLDGTPYDLQPTALRDNRVALKWTDRLSTEAGFVLSRSTNASGPGATTIPLPANATTWEDTTVAGGTTYYYVIKAVDSKGVGVASPACTITTPVTGAIPPYAVSVTVERSAILCNRITWVNPAPLELDGFVIERSPVPNLDWRELARVGPATTYYDDATIRPGIAYSYRVRGYNNNGMIDEGSSGTTGGFSVPEIGSAGNDAPAVVNGILYFLDPAGDQVLRYDRSAGGWLTPLELLLPEQAQHWVFSSQGIFVATAYSVFAMNLDGSGWRQVQAGAQPVSDIWVVKDNLCISRKTFPTGTVWSFQLGAGLSITPRTYSTVIVAPDLTAVSPEGTMVGATTGVSHLVTGLQMDLVGAVGTLGYYNASGSPQSIKRLWALPGGLYFLDNLGFYYGRDGSPAGRLNLTRVDDCVVTPEGDFVVLSDGLIRAYDPSLQPVAEGYAPPRAMALDVQGGNLRVIQYNEDVAVPFGFDLRPLSWFDLPTDPTVIRRTTALDDLFVTSDGTLWGYDNVAGYLLRWSFTERRFVERIVTNIKGTNALWSFSKDKNAFYGGGYNGAVVTKIDLASPQRTRTTTPPRVYNLRALVGDRFVVSAGSDTFMVDENGVRGITVGGMDKSSIKGANWDPVNQIFFKFDIGSSPQGPSWFGPTYRPGSFSTYGLSVDLRQTPFVRPSGTLGRLFTGSGTLGTYPTLGKVAKLQLNRPRDADWLDDSLVVLEPSDSDRSQITRWGIDGQLLGRTEIAGVVDRLKAIDGSKFLVSVVIDGQLRFDVRDKSLQPLPASSLGAPVVTRFTRSHEVLAGEGASLVVSAQGTGPLSYQWRRNGTPLPDAHEPVLDVASGAPSVAGTYEVTVTNGEGQATASATISIAAPRTRFLPGSFLLIHGTKIRELAPDGTVVGELTVPAPPKPNYWTLDEVVVDEVGNLHALVGGTYSLNQEVFARGAYHIQTYHPRTDEWTSTPVPEVYGEYAARGLAVMGHRARLHDATLDLRTGLPVWTRGYVVAPAGPRHVLVSNSDIGVANSYQIQDADGKAKGAWFSFPSVQTVACDPAGYQVDTTGTKMMKYDLVAGTLTNIPLPVYVVGRTRLLSPTKAAVLTNAQQTGGIVVVDLVSGAVQQIAHPLPSTAKLQVVPESGSTTVAALDPLTLFYTQNLSGRVGSRMGTYGPSSDFDDDGRSDWMEVLTNSSQSLLRGYQFSLQPYKLGKMMVYTIPANLNNDLTPMAPLEFSPDMVHWSTTKPEGVFVENSGPVWGWQQVRANTELNPRFFVRCRVPSMPARN